MVNNNGSIRDKWVFWFVIIDGILVFVTALMKYIPSEASVTGYGTIRLLLRQMSLGIEMNVGVWWLGMHLFLATLISYEIFSSQETKNRFAWLFFSVIFLGLSVDELGSIHERVFSNWGVILGIFLIGVVAGVYAIWQLLRTKESRRSAVLLLVGLGLMTSAVPMEYLHHNLNWPSELLGLRIGVEEGVEIFGALLCLIAVVQQRQGLPWPKPWSRVIPNPLRMRGLYIILIGGFIMHIGSALLTSLFWDIGRWGSPSAYFPSFIFIILSSSCFWVSYSDNVYRPKVWRLKSFILLITSLVTFYLVLPESTIQYFVFWGEITSSDKIITLWGTYLIVLFVILYYRDSISILNKIILFFCVLLFFVISYAIGYQIVYSISTGFVSILIGFVVMLECYSVGLDVKLSQEENKTIFDTLLAGEG